MQAIGFAGSAAGFFQRAHGLVVPVAVVREDGPKQALLVIEVVPHQGQWHIGRFGDLADRHGVEAALGELLLGGLQDGLLAVAARRQPGSAGRWHAGTGNQGVGRRAGAPRRLTFP